MLVEARHAELPPEEVLRKNMDAICFLALISEGARHMSPTRLCRLQHLQALQRAGLRFEETVTCSPDMVEFIWTCPGGWVD